MRGGQWGDAGIVCGGDTVERLLFLFQVGETSSASAWNGRRAAQLRSRGAKRWAFTEPSIAYFHMGLLSHAQKHKRLLGRLKTSSEAE